MLISILVFVAGLLLTKYGIASIIAGIGGVVANLGIGKKGDGD